MKVFNVVFALLMSATLGGCTILGFNHNIEEQSDDSANDIVSEKHFDLIAKNLVSVLAQIESTHPMQTTLQMTAPSTPFGKSVYNEIESLGYGIQVVDGDLGDAFLSYKAEISQSESGFRNSYSIDAKGVNIERDYTIIEGNVVPTSIVTVKGGSAYDPVINDEIFESLPEPGLSDIDIIKDSQPQVVVYASAKENAVSIAPIAGPEKYRNVYELQHSNFKSLFTNYNDVESQILIFANDSLMLGSKNKQKMKKLAANIVPETDIVSIIGCSHGRTALENGNQVLAEGRAQRVKESLMYAGIRSDIIYDEACWASQYWDEMAPRRGVMVTHKRVVN